MVVSSVAVSLVAVSSVDVSLVVVSLALEVVPSVVVSMEFNSIAVIAPPALRAWRSAVGDGPSPRRRLQQTSIPKSGTMIMNLKWLVSAIVLASIFAAGDLQENKCGFPVVIHKL